MKKVINLVVVLVCMFTSVTVFGANINLPVEDLPKATKIISEKVKISLRDIEIEKNTFVKVIFTVNSDGEIAVLDVRTKDVNLKDYIKKHTKLKIK